MSEDLLEEFADLFPDELPKGLPPLRPMDHRIDLKPWFKPPARRAYRMAPQEEGTLRETLDDLLEKSLIEPANSPYASGVLFVPKANGKLRLVVDYRPLNQQTVVDQYPLPRIDELLDQARIC